MDWSVIFCEVQQRQGLKQNILVSIEYEDILAQKPLPRRLQKALGLALLREKIFEIVDVDEKML
jgi:hypothetical protein